MKIKIISALLLMFLFLTPVFSQVNVGGTVISGWESDFTNKDSLTSNSLPNTFNVEGYGNINFSGEHIFGTVEVSTDGKDLNIYQVYAGANFNLGNELIGNISAGKFANFWYQNDGGIYGLFYHLTGGSISQRFVPENPIGASLKLYKDNTVVAAEIYNDSNSTHKQALVSFSSNYKRFTFGMFLFTSLGKGNFSNLTTYGVNIGYTFMPKFGSIYVNVETNYHPYENMDAVIPFAGYMHFMPKKFPVGVFFRYENKDFNIKKGNQEFTVALTANPWNEFSIAAGWKNRQPAPVNMGFITGSFRF